MKILYLTKVLEIGFKSAVLNLFYQIFFLTLKGVEKVNHW